MKLFFVSILLLMHSVQLHAQNTINHIVVIDPDKMSISEKIEINTSAEYLFKIEKDLNGKKVEIYPNKYDRIEGTEYDFLLFDAPKIEVVYSEMIIP